MAPVIVCRRGGEKITFAAYEKDILSFHLQYVQPYPG